MTRTESHRPAPFRFGFGRLLLAITLSAVWFLSLRPAVDPDYGWHIRNGRHALDGSVFSGKDLYSWTAGGYWIVHEWLTEAAMSLVHDSLGASGNSIIAALLGTIAFWLVAVRLRRRGMGWLAILSTVIVAFFGTMMSVGVRPQALELVYLAALGLMVDSWISGRSSDKKFLVATAAGAILWTNTHGSFPLMTALLGLGAVGLSLERDSRWLKLAAASGIAALAALVNPWGWRIYEFATQSMMSKPTLSLIEEWRKPDLLSGSLLPLDLAILLGAIAAVVALRRIVGRSAEPSGIEAGVRIDDVTIAAGLLYLAVSSGRHVMLFGVGAAPLVAWTIDKASARISFTRKARSRLALSNDLDTPSAWWINWLAAVAVAVTLAVAGWNTVRPAAQRGAMMARYPVELVDDVARLNRPPARLLNEYSWGGFLIGNGLDPVFIDGRSELYGDAQLLRYSAITRLSPGWQRTIDSLGINLALLPRESTLARALAADDWEIVATDSVGALLKRR